MCLVAIHHNKSWPLGSNKEIEVDDLEGFNECFELCSCSCEAFMDRVTAARDRDVEGYHKIDVLALDAKDSH